MNQACQTRDLQSLRIRPDQVLVFLSIFTVHPSERDSEPSCLSKVCLPVSTRPLTRTSYWYICI